jgi:DNA polymerase elongation subunit (family B)
MKHLEETPWFICDEGDINFCAYVDTDSNYFNAEPLLKHLYPNFEDFSDKEKDNILEKVALKYQDIITDHYNILAKDCFNVPNFIGNTPHKHKLEMKTEAVIRSAYFRATRRYAQWITKQEGIEKEILDIKGLEFMKANFPPILGEFFNDILQQVLKGATHSDILKQIKKFKTQILDGTIPLTQLGNPTSVKKLDKYSGRSARAGEIFTNIEKGAPAPVRAAIRYNDLMRLWKLDKQYNLITISDKVKWIYLKDNPYKIEALAYLGYDIPEKINDFLETYADRQKVFDSILLNKLEGFFSDLSWELNLNPYLNIFESFEI